jgi:glycosyltransferase involved in cell wall biosynthesis
VHVQLVDPAAYTPPYDHALASALARAGARVDLVTTQSTEWNAAIEGTAAHLALPYQRHRDFYRHSAGLPSPWRQVARALEHPVGLRRLRGRGADVTHLQWAPLSELDAFGLPRHRPLVVTAHDILTREPRPLQHAAQRAIYRRADLVVVHSAHGRDRLVDEVGLSPDRIRVIPHGAFDHLAAVPRAPLPPELSDEPAVDADNLQRLQERSFRGVENNLQGLQIDTTRSRSGSPRRPIVLSFGLIRPYKGTDLLLRAWRTVRADAELWIVGKPRGVDLAELRALADERVRFVPRFVTDGELAACFDAAQLAVLPYREIEQSGVLATALAFGTPVLASAVGAFPEAAALGAAATVPPNDEAALGAAIERLIGDPTERALLTVGARALSRGAWSWDEVARQHLAAYAEIVG